MAFSVDQLADLLELLGPSPKSGHRGKESRRARRVRHKTQLAIIPCGEDGPAGAAITVQTEDLSLRGVRMIHTAPMQAGDEFLLLLPRKRQEPLPILCTVAHCTALGAEHYSIGAEFVCIPDREPAAARPRPTASERTDGGRAGVRARARRRARAFGVDPRRAGARPPPRGLPRSCRASVG